MGGGDLQNLLNLLFGICLGQTLYLYKSPPIEIIKHKPIIANQNIATNGNPKAFKSLAAFNSFCNIHFLASFSLFSSWEVCSMSSKPFPALSPHRSSNLHSQQCFLLLRFGILHPKPPIQHIFNPKTVPHRHCFAWISCAIICHLCSSP